MAKFGIDSNMVFDADGKSVAARLSDHDTSLVDRANDILARAINVKFPFGTNLTAAKGDGSNETTVLQSIIDYAGQHKMNVFFPSGMFMADKLIPHTDSGWFGAGEKNTVLTASVSSQTDFIVAQDTNPIQNFFIKDMTLQGNSSNVNQNGLRLNAVAQTSTPYTGGFWYCRFENLLIEGFNGSQIYISCTDGSGDMANQFLFFRNIRAFRVDNTTSRSLKISGQFGQVLFEGCEFDGVNQTTIGAINVEITSLNSTNDQVYAVHFDTCTFQSTDLAISMYFVTGILFTNAYFENCNSGVKADGSSYGVFKLPRFANVSNGGNGYCIYATGASKITATDIMSFGSIDTVVKNNNGHIDYSVLFGSTTSSGITVQQAVASDGSLPVSFDKMLLVNTSATHIKTLNDNHATGTIISLIAFAGSILLDKTGNINFNSSNTLLTVPQNGTVTLIKSDLGVTTWVVIGTTGTFS